MPLRPGKEGMDPQIEKGEMCPPIRAGQMGQLRPRSPRPNNGARMEDGEIEASHLGMESPGDAAPLHDVDQRD